MRPILLLLFGCSDSGFMNSADLGVDPGGSQDIELARTLIEGGQIPSREHFTVEGIYSEHELPLEGAACEALLCPRAAAAWTEPADGSAPGYLLQIGFGTAITTASFERAPLRLAVTIDVSGSMEDNLDFVKRGLRMMVDQLDAADEMAIVVYGARGEVLQGLTTMDADGKSTMNEVIDDIHSEGSTNMEEGMSLAYGLLAPEAGAVGVEDRLVLVTDAQPNTGSTSMDSFLGMARYYAAAGIGITVLGVDLNIGSELQDALAKTPGGNAYFLADDESLDHVFKDEFDYMMSPLAYDLEVSVTPGPDLGLGEGLGMPVDAAAGVSAFGASTLFLSSRDGGMGLTLEGAEVEVGAPLADLQLSWRPVDGAAQSDTLSVIWQGGSAYVGAAGEADDLGVYTLSVLTDAWRALIAGAEFCEGTTTDAEAHAVVGLAAERLGAVGVELDDPPIRALGGLITKLDQNLARGAEACVPADAYLY